MSLHHASWDRLRTARFVLVQVLYPEGSFHPVALVAAATLCDLPQTLLSAFAVVLTDPTHVCDGVTLDGVVPLLTSQETAGTPLSARTVNAVRRRLPVRQVAAHSLVRVCVFAACNCAMQCDPLGVCAPACGCLPRPDRGV